MFFKWYTVDAGLGDQEVAGSTPGRSRTAGSDPGQVVHRHTHVPSASEVTIVCRYRNSTNLTSYYFLIKKI